MAIFLTQRKQIISNQSHHVKKSEFRNLENFACGTRNCLGFGIGSTPSGIWNPVPEIQNPVTGKFTAWNQESKIALDFLTWGDLAFKYLDKIRDCFVWIMRLTLFENFDKKV